MTSYFVSLLLIFSIGTLVSSLSVDKLIRSSHVAHLPIKNTSLCSVFMVELLSLDDSRLKDLDLRAAVITCKPEFQNVSVETFYEIFMCIKHGPLQGLAKSRCHFSQAAEADCSARTKAINCLLDLVGASCGGKDAIMITAILRESMLLTSNQSTATDCEITALEEHLKVFESSPPSVPPELRPEALCIAIEKGLANLTSDPEYFEQRAPAILCDGKELKKTVKEMNDCVKSILFDLAAMVSIPRQPRNLDGVSCRGQTELLQYQVAMYAKQCGGQPTVKVYAFETELWLELLRALNKDSKNSFLQGPCIDEILIELRALQKLMKGSPKRQ